jgi:hypothetical protein
MLKEKLRKKWSLIDFIYKNSYLFDWKEDLKSLDALE